MTKRHAETFVGAVQILRVVERILRSARTPAAKLAADMIADILVND
jgi:hypothetical protein